MNISKQLPNIKAGKINTFNYLYLSGITGFYEGRKNESCIEMIFYIVIASEGTNVEIFM